MKTFLRKKLSISDEEFYEIMRTAPKKHSDYSLDIFNNFIFKNISNILKKLFSYENLYNWLRTYFTKTFRQY